MSQGGLCVYAGRHHEEDIPARYDEKNDSCSAVRLYLDTMYELGFVQGMKSTHTYMNISTRL